MDAAPILDPKALDTIRRMGGPGLVMQLIASFRGHAPARVAEAVAAAERGDGESVVRAAHALRSSAGNFGATALYDAATTLEAAGQHGGDDLGPLAHRMASAFADVLVHLDAIEGQGG